MATSLEFWLSSDTHDDVGARPTRRARLGDDLVAQPALQVPDDDRATAERIRAGDNATFDHLYLDSYQSLAEYAAALTHDPAAAHDIVQEVFLNVWRTRDTWTPGHIGAYLFQSTRNRALNHLGAHKRHERIHAAFPADTPLGVGEAPLAPDEGMHLARFLAALDQAIDQLPPQRREVAVLRWRHGKSLTEIATIVGSSAKAVSMQLGRTRASLQAVVDTYLRDE